MKRIGIRNYPFISKKNEHSYDLTTTQEKLALQVSADVGMVCRYDDFVIVVDYYWRGGFIAAIYEFAESPEDAGGDGFECLLHFCEASDSSFEDGGHAMAWALKGIIDTQAK